MRVWFEMCHVTHRHRTERWERGDDTRSTVAFSVAVYVCVYVYLRGCVALRITHKALHIERTYTYLYTNMHKTHKYVNEIIQTHT